MLIFSDIFKFQRELFLGITYCTIKILNIDQSSGGNEPMRATRHARLGRIASSNNELRSVSACEPPVDCTSH